MSSRSHSSLFDAIAETRKLTPVMLPPGRLRLATEPSLTGSSPLLKTMGIVVVAALAANVERVTRVFRQSVALRSRPHKPVDDRDRVVACRRPARLPSPLRTRRWPSAG